MIQEQEINFPLTTDRFEGIEFAFNQKNIWINIQEIDFAKTEDSMDFGNSDYWRPVCDGKLPSPIVDKLQIDQKLVFEKYPDAEKKILWRDALEELHAPYTRPDGLISRYFLFEKDLSNVYQVREYFQSLKQLLKERRIFIKEEKMIEYFEPQSILSLRVESKDQSKNQRQAVKRPIGVISHQILHSISRTIVFDPILRLDRLKERVEIFGKTIIEKFDKRDDGLCERKLSIVPENSTSTSKVTLYQTGPRIEKMTQKYVHSTVDPTYHETYALANSVYKVAFDFVTGKMTIVYHHQPNCISNFSIQYKRDREKEKKFAPYLNRYDPNPPTIDNWTLKDTQVQLTDICEKGLADAQQIASELVQWIQFRLEEESRPFLKMKSSQVSLHRKLYSEMEKTQVLVEQPPPEPKPEGEGNDDEDSQTLNANDPLCVYFPNDGSEITKEVAEEVVKKAHEALIERLNIEQLMLDQRINQENTNLRNKIKEFESDQHQSRSIKQGNDHQQYVQKQTFLISVLQKRKARFLETALRRMRELAKSLKNHPKLTPFLGATDIDNDDELKVKIHDALVKEKILPQ